MRGEFASASMRSSSAQISKPIPSTTSDEIGWACSTQAQIDCPAPRSRDFVHHLLLTSRRPGAYTPIKQKSGGNAELADATGEYGSSSFESGLGRYLPWN